MERRSNVIVILGLAVFIVGAAATYFLVRGDGGSDNAGSVADGVPVLYASDDIPAGTSGTAAIQAGAVKTKNVTPTARPASALTDPSQLGGRTTTVGVPKGTVLTDDAFPVAQTRVGTVKIPDGKTAVAVQMTNVPGVAGYVGSGDHIDVYGLLKPDSGGSGGTEKRAALIMQDVEVLSVNGANVTPSPGQPGAPDRVFLVAVNAAQAEQLAFFTTSHQLYFSLVPKGQAPVPGTPGVDLSNALDPR